MSQEHGAFSAGGGGLKAPEKERTDEETVWHCQGNSCRVNAPLIYLQYVLLSLTNDRICMFHRCVLFNAHPVWCVQTSTIKYLSLSFLSPLLLLLCCIPVTSLQAH